MDTVRDVQRKGMAMMSKREEFQKHVEEDLAIWANRLKTLETRAGSALLPAQKKSIEEWEMTAATLRTKLAALEAAVGDRWEELKLEVLKRWHDLDESLKTAEASQNARLDAEKAGPPAPASGTVRPEAPPVPPPGPGTMTDNVGAQMGANVGVPGARPEEHLPGR